MRRIIAVLAGAIMLLPAGTANAATGYRYWSFWLTAKGGWEMSSLGAASIQAEPGSVYGWRFVTSGLNPSADLDPRVEPAFTCQDDATEVAIVVDYGDPADYDGETPPAARTVCVTVTPGDSVMTATARAAEIRENAGFVCGLDRLPTAGCGEAVSVVSATADTTESDGAAEEERLDMIARIVTSVLAVVMFAVAWQRMQWQKARNRKTAEAEDAETDR